MATVVSNSLGQSTDDQELSKYLRERFNVPTKEWWSVSEERFSQLCTVLGQKDSSSIEEEEGDEFSPATARAHVLPSTIILPAEAHSLRLTATDEPLECAIFGTITPSLYLEVFWEHVGKAQQAREANLVVHEVINASVLRILLTFGDLLFELKYMHCELLIRKYPSILDAPWSFLHDASNCTVSVKEAVQQLQQGARLRKYLDGSTPQRSTYNFTRAWARVSGVSGKWGLTPSEMVKLYQDDEEDSISGLIQTFFLNAEKEYSDLFLSQLKTLGVRQDAELTLDAELQFNPLEFLSRLYDLPVNQHMNFPYYLRLQVISMNASKAKTGQWLSRYMEQQLPQLRSRLQRLFPPSVESRCWPRRLVSPSSLTTNSFYEGIYILGVQISDVKQLKSAIEEAFTVWQREVEGHPLSLDAQGRVFVSVLSSTELEKENLRPCTQFWPRPVVTDESDSYKSLPEKSIEKTIPKRAKANTNNTEDNTSKTPKSRLRPASDVLSRLRHDNSYDIDEFVVGYKDRHSARLMEKAARSWARDTTDEEWIPEHRIEYFKRYVGGKGNGDAEIVWDREKRVDRMFRRAWAS